LGNFIEENGHFTIIKYSIYLVYTQDNRASTEELLRIVIKYVKDNTYNYFFFFLYNGCHILFNYFILCRLKIIYWICLFIKKKKKKKKKKFKKKKKKKILIFIYLKKIKKLKNICKRQIKKE